MAMRIAMGFIIDTPTALQFQSLQGGLTSRFHASRF
jgi:hypothetical protein